MVEVETATASPFASSLLFDYVATYMYEGDTPNAERRAAALSLDRDLLRELLGQEELRDLIDPAALERVEADLQCLSELTRATNRDGLLDVLRRVGDLRWTRCPLVCSTGWIRRRCWPTCAASGAPLACASTARSAGSTLPTRACIATRWAPRPPGGLPAAFLEDVPDALSRLLRRYAATHGPFTTADVHGALRDRRLAPRCASSSAPASWSAASCARAAPSASGVTPRCCGGCAARRWPSCARRSSRPRRGSSRASCPRWQGVDRHPASGAGIDRLRETLVPLQGLALPAEVWEHDVLPRRVGAYSPTWMDQLCAAGEVVWIGAGALGRNSGRVALYFREDLALLGSARHTEGTSATTTRTRRSARDWPPAPASSPTCSSTSKARRPRRSRRRCGTSRGRASSPTTPTPRCGPRG